MSSKSSDPKEADKLRVSLAVTRGAVTPYQARKVIRETPPSDSISDRLGISEELRAAASGFAQLPKTEQEECLAIFKDLFPQNPRTPRMGLDPGARFGKYVIESELGRGGMGIVYKAKDAEADRWIALKCIQGSGDETERLRFEREARTALALQHPGIIKIHQVGSFNETPFIAMEFVEGTPLSELLSLHRPQREKPTLHRSLEMIRDVALALGYAHSCRVVHRDVKPDNVVVDAAGRIHVLDFGLARELKPGLTVTETGDLLGTPRYMAPEQVLGEREKIGPWTDVWALGVMLYDVVARVAPFEGETPAEVLHKIAAANVKPLRSWNPKVARGLEILVMKCLEADPAHRYADGIRLAEDLSRHLEGIPILARPPGVLVRLGKQLARRRAIAITAALGMTAALAVAGVMIPKLAVEKQHAAQAQAATAQAELSLRLWGSIANFITEAEINARAGDLESAGKRLDSGIKVCRDFIRDRDLPQARYFLGRLLHDRGNTAEALTELDQALRMDEHLGEAHHERGMILVEEYRSRYKAAQTNLIALRIVGSSPPSIEEVEKEDSVLPSLKARARGDLSVQVGQSSYFRPVDSLFGKALLAQVEGLSSEAREHLESTVSLDPSHASAWTALSELHSELGDYDRAITCATEAVRRHQGLPSAWLARSSACAQKYRFTQTEALRKTALEDAERAISLGAVMETAYSLRGGARRMAGDSEGAIADLNEALRLNPRSVGSLLRRAAVYVEKGDLKRALQDTEQAIRINPLSAEAHSMRGNVLYSMENLAGDVKEQDEAIRLNPRYAVGYVNRSYVRMARGDLTGAKKDIDEALRMDPGIGPAYGTRADILQMMGDHYSALRDFDRAIVLLPWVWGNYSGRAELKRIVNDLDGALVDADEGVRLAPKQPGAYLIRGEVRMDRGEFEQALGDLTTTLKFGPSTLAQYDLGHLYRLQGNEQESLSHFNRTIKIDSGFGPGYSARGDIRRRNKDLEGALADYNACLGRDRYWKAHVGRGLLHRLKGDPAAAIQEFDEALRLVPQCSAALIGRSATRLLQGDPAGAYADLEIALKIDPRTPLNFYTRGLAHLGERDDLTDFLDDLRLLLDRAPAEWGHRPLLEERIRDIGKQR